MKKRILAGLVSAVMVMSLAGCGSSSGGGESSTGKSAEEASTTEESSAAETDSGSSNDKSDAQVKEEDFTTDLEVSGDGGTYKITLITMDQIDVHWQNVNAGCERAIRDLADQGYEVELSWMAPETKDNAQQITKIENAIANKTEAIMLAATDSTACNNAIEEAIAAGIKIVYVDSPATIDGEATFSTDNKAAGVQAGELLLKTLQDAGIEEGTIGIVGAQAGAQSCVDREDGFREVFEGQGYDLLETQFSEGDATKAQEFGTNMVNNGAIALYGVNESAAIGVGNVAKDSSETIYAVGFDASSAVCSLIKNDNLVGAMAQKPANMGYNAVYAAVAALEGQDLGGAVVDTGAVVVTKDNASDYE